jgi:hypothetical protein
VSSSTHPQTELQQQRTRKRLSRENQEQNNSKWFRQNGESARTECRRENMSGKTWSRYSNDLPNMSRAHSEEFQVNGENFVRKWRTPILFGIYFANLPMLTVVTFRWIELFSWKVGTFSSPLGGFSGLESARKVEFMWTEFQKLKSGQHQSLQA